MSDSPVRCPFCHEGVAPASDPWVACAGCLARHHVPCWRELGHCAACAHAVSTAPVETVPARPGGGSALLVLLLSGGAAMVLVLLLLGAGVLVYVRQQTAREARVRAEQAAVEALESEAQAAREAREFEARAAREARTAARDQRAAPGPRRQVWEDAVVVEDGRGCWVGVWERTRTIVFGLDQSRFTGGREQVSAERIAGGRWTQGELIPAALVLYEQPGSTSRVHPLPEGVSLGTLSATLRATDPAALDVRALLEELRAPRPR